MASAGPNSPGTCANVDLASGRAWTDYNNAKASDDAWASSGAGASAETTDYLWATNFGFSIPSGATINGIKVEIEVKATAPNCNSDNSVKAVKGGTASGDDKSRDSGSKYSTTDTYVTYGGETDLWGLTWTYSDINASDFGVAFSCYKLGYIETLVDHIRITVYYTEVVVLAIGDCSHALTNDAIVLIDERILVIGDCTHALSNDAITLVCVSVDFLIIGDGIISLKTRGHPFVQGWDGSFSRHPLKRYGCKLKDISFYKRVKNKKILTIS